MTKEFLGTACLLAVAMAALMAAGCDRQTGPANSPASSAGKTDKQATGGRPPSKKFPVRTVTVATQPVTYEVPAVGQLVEENMFKIPARVTGPAEKVSFNEGDIVTTGQELCRIDYTRYSLMAEKAKNEVTQQQAAVTKAEANLADTISQTSGLLNTARLDVEQAESEYRRRAALSSSQISAEDRITYELKFKRAQSVYDMAATAVRTKVSLDEAALNEQRTMLAVAQASAALAEQDLKNATIRAPIAGVIQERQVTEGQYLTAGSTAAVMAQTNPLRLRFTVPESKSSNLTKDMKVRFAVPAYPGREFEASIYDIGSMADPESHEVQCWGRVANSSGELRPGYFAKAHITIESKDASVVVPLGSVLPTEIGMVCYVVKDGVAVRKKVETGLQVTGDAIEILHGLDPGEELVVEGADSLQENVPVVSVGKNVIKSVNASSLAKSNSTSGSKAREM